MSDKMIMQVIKQTACPDLLPLYFEVKPELSAPAANNPSLNNNIVSVHSYDS